MIRCMADVVAAWISAIALAVGVLTFLISRTQTGRYSGTEACIAYRTHVIELHRAGLSAEQITDLLAPEDLTWCARRCGSVEHIVQHMKPGDS